MVRSGLRLCLGMDTGVDVVVVVWWMLENKDVESRTLKYFSVVRLLECLSEDLSAPRMHLRSRPAPSTLGSVMMWMVSTCGCLQGAGWHVPLACLSTSQRVSPDIF